MIHDNLRLILCTIVVLPLCAVEQDYQEQLEAAIVQTNAPKVMRLLKRRNKTSIKNFNHMLGWANDIVEERRMLEPTPREALGAVLSSMVGTASSIAGLCYYFDVGNFQVETRNTFIGEEKGFFAMLGTAGLLASYGLYSWWSGPRKRLSHAYDILFALEDAVDAMEKKRKAREKAAKRRELKAREIA